jgi:uncharacterized protein GlcG (DUF336 family)
MQTLRRLPCAICLALCAAAAAVADDVLNTRLMSLDLARDLAQGAVDACREEGYQVSAVVVDRSAVVQVVMRDVYASRFNTEIARKKANAAILGSVSTREFLENRPDITATMNLLDDVLVLRGAVPVRSAGSLIGALGVSGAPGGDLDERCALASLDAVRLRLEFAD